MVKGFTDWLIALLELLEAEGRSVKRNLVKVGLGVVWLWLGGTLLIGAAGFLVWALWLGLSALLAPGWVALLCGLVLLVGAAISLWLARGAAR